MLHEETTKVIIGAAMSVLNDLRPGLDEKLYENALVVELKSRGYGVDQQLEYVVRYKNVVVGKLIPDMIVDGSVIVDTKVASSISDAHVAQMLGYLNITGLDVGLLLNFKDAKLTWRRVGNDRNKTGEKAESEAPGDLSS